MRLALKILFWVFLITGTGFYWLTHGMLDSIKTRYLEGVEETLVDHARILAAMVARDMEAQQFSSMDLHEAFDRAYGSRFNSQIYDLNKTGVDLRVYITDARGIILFDSARRAAIGEDYSNWRDVHLTLKGQYGARATREDANKESSSVLYVAAPILIKDRISGVLTVAKPTTSINRFLEMAQARLKLQSLVTVGLITLLSILVITRITRPVKHLTRYANDVGSGKKVQLPTLDNTEIGDMGRAFENMRVALEDRKYVETYIQTLTHEIKSPLSAIKGAAELLDEEMPREQKNRFLGNICNESDRIKHLVDRLPALAAVEAMKSINQKESLVFSTLVQEVLEQMRPVLEAKQISLSAQLESNLEVDGDPLLLKLAVSNLLQNSVDFSPENGEIEVILFEVPPVLTLEIRDSGPGIPEYAVEKIFNKFFSLQRPGSQKKSTGLGLNLVREIAELHQGRVTLENRSGKGACARLSLGCTGT